MILKHYGEICCEICNEVIHNHIDCPKCGMEYAKTDTYHSLFDEIEEEGRAIIKCMNCGQEYLCKSSKDLVNDEWSYYGGKE